MSVRSSQAIVFPRQFGCELIHSSRIRDRHENDSQAFSHHGSSERYRAVSRWFVSASLRRVCVRPRSVASVLRCVKERSVASASVAKRSVESLASCVPAYRVSLCSVASALQESPRVALAPALQSLRRTALAKKCAAYRRAVRPPRGGSAEAAAAVSPVSQNSSWVALRDVVGSLMSAIRPPASPDCGRPKSGGASQELSVLRRVRGVWMLGVEFRCCVSALSFEHRSVAFCTQRWRACVHWPSLGQAYLACDIACH